MATPAEPGSGPSGSHRLTLGQILALVALGPVVVVLASVLVGILTIAHQNSVRQDLITRVEPANATALSLQIAMLNQETGLRGYELTREPRFLQPYHLGVAQERIETDDLRAYAVQGTAGDFARVQATIHTWDALTLAPALADAGRFASQAALVRATAEGKHRFDAIRAALNSYQAKLLAKVAATKVELTNSARATEIAFAVIGLALLISLLAAGLLLRRLVTQPVGVLAGSARRVARGDLGHTLLLSGSRDLEGLGADLDAMRVRLVDELSASHALTEQLAASATDLRRSNTELEQFAYVASHDLQEPLRKVTSFVQLLADRYAGQLDDRADQYIGFAVDGAKRMQQLIGDLLAFSRVGRGDPQLVLTPLNSVVDAALADLGSAIEDSGAEFSVGELPSVPVDPTLIRTVFQNVMGNAIKFRSEQAPRVEVSAQRDGDSWLLACQDNGIGIEPEYADRIFVIFQRLHTREAYPGTGIGLAMCRKIVEFHGGSMWLDESYTAGTRMCFTLPAAAPTITAGS